MTTIGIVGFSQTAVTPLLRRWKWVVALGVALLVVIGVLLLVNLRAAVGTLAILVSLGLFVAAIDEIAEAERHTRRWPSYVLAAFWAVTGVLALRVARRHAVGARLRRRGRLLAVGAAADASSPSSTTASCRCGASPSLDGVLGVVLGVMALVWPEATVLVLAILLGLRVLFRGIMTIMFGLACGACRRCRRLTGLSLRSAVS